MQRSPTWQPCRILLVLLYALCFWILVRFLFTAFQRYSADLENERDLLDDINIDCSILKGFNMTALRELRQWKYHNESVAKKIVHSNDRCFTIKKLFRFPSAPASVEEQEYPLAYGLIIYKNIEQVMFMISAFYAPQNEYCLAVSGSSKEEFKFLVNVLGDCFPNIHVMIRPKIHWGSFEIINSTYECLNYLHTSTNSNWRYFQYLAGSDVPLKTNREMVRIFKAFNGTSNVEFSPYQKGRLRGKKIETSPLPLYKSSLSALVSREAAARIVGSAEASSLLTFLQGTAIPDEGFWGTILGNPDVFSVPGTISGAELISYRKELRNGSTEATTSSTTTRQSPRYYLSRYQQWNRCGGKFSSGSCVFGVYDVRDLLRQPHLVAHKLYIDFEPAAYFCLLKEVRLRASLPFNFDSSLYTELPQVEMQRNVPYENLTHPDWLF